MCFFWGLVVNLFIVGFYLIFFPFWGEGGVWVIFLGVI